MDSVPAIFGVTKNPYLIFSSNVFAILGLRSLFIILAKAASDLLYLEPSVAIILSFIGVKMVIGRIYNYEFPISYSLGFVVFMLSGCAASYCAKGKGDRSKDDSLSKKNDDIENTVDPFMN